MKQIPFTFFYWKFLKQFFKSGEEYHQRKDFLQTSHRQEDILAALGVWEPPYNKYFFYNVISNMAR